MSHSIMKLISKVILTFGDSMTKKFQPIVFFGSGPVAAESLRLLAAHQKITAVVTKPTTKAQMSDVANGAPIYTVSNKKELDSLVESGALGDLTLGVLIDFGIIVSRFAIDSFELGIINSHFSVLPELRGADPISFAILSGQKSTGVSLMMIDEGMDTGKILTTKSLSIDSEETTSTLTDKLIRLSDTLLQEFIPRYIAGEIQPRSQSHPDRATYSRKLTKEDGIIDWSKSALTIEKEIRAFIEWPKSRATLGTKEVVITKAHASPDETVGEPGDIVIFGKEAIGITTGDGTLWIDELKPVGKKEMPAKAFLAGYRNLVQ